MIHTTILNPSASAVHANARIVRMTIGGYGSTRCSSSVPALTSVNTHLSKQGEEALHYIVNRTQGSKPRLPAVTPSLVARASSDVPAAQL